MKNNSFPWSTVSISILLGGLFILFNFVLEDERDSISGNGIQAEAEVLSIVDAGNRYDIKPKIILKLKVIPVDDVPYETEVKMPVSQIHIPQLKPGKKIKIRYDAEDRMKVVLDEQDSNP